MNKNIFCNRYITVTKTPLPDVPLCYAYTDTHTPSMTYFMNDPLLEKSDTLYNWNIDVAWAC